MIEYVCDKPVPGVQIVESDAKWGEEKKNVGEGEKEKERTRAFSPHPPRCAVTTI